MYEQSSSGGNRSRAQGLVEPIAWNIVGVTRLEAITLVERKTDLKAFLDKERCPRPESAVLSDLFLNLEFPKNRDDCWNE